ncbi:MAG TPA: hypothetical protein GXX56_09500 [Rhodocyclaceae bacterium]|nr:hypothetical protein [Rhodocyclaceae bacterium]
MQTASKIVKGDSAAYGMVMKLAEMSQWFQFDPYPDDCYEITVKTEIAHHLDQLAADFGSTIQDDSSATSPTIVVEMDGSAIHCVRASAPATVILLDADTEAAEEGRAQEVNGEDVYVHHYQLTGQANEGSDGIDSAFVASVLDQIAKSSEPTLWTNYYRCPCGEAWEDEWESACNDKCPRCNKEIEPYISDDGFVSSEAIDAARLEALRNQGWSICADCGTEIKNIIGCPDGAEICDQCFDDGKH